MNISKLKILKPSSLEWNSGGCSAVEVSWLAFSARLETDKLQNSSQNWFEVARAPGMGANLVVEVHCEP